MGRQTVLIADSDHSVRQNLKEDIKRHCQQFVFWECCNGLEAERYIAALQPDLVFIAVELPGKSGFDVMDAVPSQPAAVFLSFSERDAAKAFEYQAIDYLIKPIASPRLQTALQRFEQWSGVTKRIAGAMESRIGYPSRILVERGQRLASVAVDEITHLKADKDYTWIHTLNGESYLSTAGIGQLERKLNPQNFIRIHRSYIVNLDHIQELYRDISKLFIALPNAIEINVGRNYLPTVKELIF